MFRYRRNIKQYRAAPRLKHCPFCDTAGQEEIIEETPHAYVMQNKFGYDLWEFRNVTEHLMAIPKRHVQSLEELNLQERMEIIDIIAEYEAKNYNVYARAVTSVQRTVPMHQHTHLIKTDDVPARGSFFLRKPYFLYKF